MSFSSVDQNMFFIYWFLIKLENVITDKSNTFYFELEGLHIQGGGLIGSNIFLQDCWIEWAYN